MLTLNRHKNLTQYQIFFKINVKNHDRFTIFKNDVKLKLNMDNVWGVLL
jgi:hypothetical protein